MKAFLMYKDRDVDLDAPSLPHEPALTQDLELDALVEAMALDDKFIFAVAKRVLLSGLTDVDTITYRQHILKDGLKWPAVVREIYAIAAQAIESERKMHFGIFREQPSTILHRSIEVLQLFVGMLKQLRNIAREHAHDVGSQGFTAFFAMLEAELGDEYFAGVQRHLKELQFRDGVLISAQLGEGNKGTHYVLRKPQAKEGWMRRIWAQKPPGYSLYISDRDESGFRALSELKDRGINLVANALAQSTDHILAFFTMLRTELAFYVGCLNLHEQLSRKGLPLCFPVPVALGEYRHAFTGLYDVYLALTLEQGVVGNDGNADQQRLVIVTGTNQGGKSTFLRSIGVSQVMMQCGMFVPAESFCANVCDGLFTHYKREEDATMTSGKLDEELNRMSEIVDNVTSKSMVLFNESFAATNEREGSEIARQIISALVEQGLKVFCVTHLYQFARGLYDSQMDGAMFLRAQRQDDGTRTFKIVEGEPLKTSYGEDLYDRIFGRASSAG